MQPYNANLLPPRPLQPHYQWLPRPRGPCLLKRPVLVRRAIELDVEMPEHVCEREADFCEGEAFCVAYALAFQSPGLKGVEVEERGAGREMQSERGGLGSSLLANAVPRAHGKRLHDLALVLCEVLVAEPAGRGEDAGGVEVEAGVVGGVLVELDAVLERRNVRLSFSRGRLGIEVKRLDLHRRARNAHRLLPLPWVRFWAGLSVLVGTCGMSRR